MLGIVVVGAPGAGKSTCCAALARLMEAMHRPFAVVNLDPANEDSLPYTASIDVRALIRVEDVMERDGDALGPNGALVFCMEFLEKHVDWLVDALGQLDPETTVILDCPGQVELYTHYHSVRNILSNLQREGLVLCALQMFDVLWCADPSTFISVLLTGLTTLMHLELPIISVLSKLDTLGKSVALPYPIEYYTDVPNPSLFLESFTKHPFFSKLFRFSEELVDIIQDYNLLSFTTFEANDAKSVHSLLRAADAALGYEWIPEHRKKGTAA